MTIETDQAVLRLSEAECWHLLGEAQMGRLAVAAEGEVDIFPLNFVVSAGALYFRTAPGEKLVQIAVHPTVAFEIDGYTADTAFSVVVKGVAERLERQSDIDEADLLPLSPWIPTLKYRWVRILPASVSGVSFRRGAEPDRY